MLNLPVAARLGGARGKTGQRRNRWVQGEHIPFDELTSLDYRLQIISELREMLIKKGLLPVYVIRKYRYFKSHQHLE